MSQRSLRSKPPSFSGRRRATGDDYELTIWELLITCTISRMDYGFWRRERYIWLMQSGCHVIVLDGRKLESI